MQIVPVLDLMQGQIVRGMGGERHRYLPIVSGLTDSHEPLAVARALRLHFGFCELYLADLDAIAGQPPAFALYELLQRAGFHLWVDAGIRGLDEARALKRASVATLVA